MWAAAPPGHRDLITLCGGTLGNAAFSQNIIDKLSSVYVFLIRPEVCCKLTVLFYMRTGTNVFKPKNFYFYLQFISNPWNIATISCSSFSWSWFTMNENLKKQTKTRLEIKAMKYFTRPVMNLYNTWVSLFECWITETNELFTIHSKCFRDASLYCAQNFVRLSSSLQ